MKLNVVLLVLLEIWLVDIVSSQSASSATTTAPVDDSSSSDNFAYARTHGCLMIIAWLFCASTGIIIARHFKFMFPTRKICGLKIWFVIHRPLMILVAVISVVAFIVILAFEEWTWLDTEDLVAFVHSIFGIVTIGLAILQILFSFFRCKPDHKKRFIFNYFHRSLGIFTFVCSVVTIFLGVNTSVINLGNIGWELYIGWVIWLIILILVFEIFTVALKEPKQKSEENRERMNKIFERSKIVLLILHLVVSLAFTIALIVFIGSTTEPTDS